MLELDTHLIAINSLKIWKMDSLSGPNFSFNGDETTNLLGISLFESLHIRGHQSSEVELFDLDARTPAPSGFYPMHSEQLGVVAVHRGFHQQSAVTQGYGHVHGVTPERGLPREELNGVFEQPRQPQHLKVDERLGRSLNHAKVSTTINQSRINAIRTD